MPLNQERSNVPPLAARVRAFMHEEALWQADERLLVAVSGGPDSVALLDLLAHLTSGAPHPYVVAHINHGLRPEAGDDAAFVEEMALRYGAPFVSCRVDVKKRVAEHGETLEEAARVLRYAALQELAHDTDTRVIVTGHTADDQAETVLMRLLRGAGLTGLAGIPARRGNIVRPLLPIWRHEIMTYLREHDLPYRTDLTNYTLDMTRNRLRLELLPMLEREYTPRLRVRLQHLAAMARQDGYALESWADETFARLRQWMPDGLALPPALELPHAIRWRLWRLAIAEVRGSIEDIGYDHLEAIHNLPPGQQVHLPGVRVLHEAGRLVFLPLPMVDHPVRITERALPVPGRLCLTIPDICLTVEMRPAPVPIEGGDVAILDAGAVHGPLTVRSWRPGDRFHPLGAPGSRKLQDIFTDAGVPRRLRAHVPVISDAEGIVWLAGFRIADRVKVLHTTTQVVRLTVEWELNPWILKPSDVA